MSEFYLLMICGVAVIVALALLIAVRPEPNRR
jgi:hypothetical protein